MARRADPARCKRCTRLSGFLKQVKAQHPDYWCRPVPSFGPPGSRLLVVGLAPGMHGANATGRPFTGDHAGILLYRTLHAFGFADRPESVAADDGLELLDCRITNAVRCLPPENKPTGAEVNACNEYLSDELTALEPGGVVLALGSIAHRAVLKASGLKAGEFRFGHDLIHPLPGERWLLDSYHCSRYNTQTGRLTEPMFQQVFRHARKLLDR